MQNLFQTWRKEAWNGKLFLASQILVGLVDPIGAGRIEDVEVDGIFERLGFVRHVRGDAQNLAGVDHDFVAVDRKLQGALKDISKLFVVVAVLGDDAAFFQQHTRQHNFLTNDELSLQKRVQIFERDRVPGDVLEFDLAGRMFGDGTLGT